MDIRWIIIILKSSTEILLWWFWSSFSALTWWLITRNRRINARLGQQSFQPFNISTNYSVVAFSVQSPLLLLHVSVLSRRASCSWFVILQLDNLVTQIRSLIQQRTIVNRALSTTRYIMLICTNCSWIICLSHFLLLDTHLLLTSSSFYNQQQMTN